MPLTYCGFPESYWKRSSLKGTDFCFGNLSSSTFQDCDLSRARMFGTGYMGITFQGGNLSRLYAPGCTFDYGTFISLVASRAEFAGSSLRETTWRDCVLVGTSFRECDMTGATFIEGCTLPCDFTRANLDDVVFADCDLHEATFTWANLTCAAFRGSSLAGANLYGANLEDVSFDSVQQLQTAALGSIAHACTQLFIHLGHNDCYRLLDALVEKARGNLAEIGLGDMLSYPLARREDEDQETDDEDTRIKKAFRRDMLRVAVSFCAGIVQQREHPEGNPVAAVLTGWLHTFLEQ